MEPTLVIAATSLLGLGLVAAALLRAWEGWLALKRRELDAVANGRRDPDDTRGVAPMPYTDVFGRKRYRNVEVNIDEETLQKIAEQTGGQYFRADSQKKLREIYDKIDEMEKTEVEVERYFNYDEWFPFLVVAGLALLLLELILANTVWLKLP